MIIVPWLLVVMLGLTKLSRGASGPGSVGGKLSEAIPRRERSGRRPWSAILGRRPKSEAVFPGCYPSPGRRFAVSCKAPWCSKML